jgi:outer membrane protein assembly factor BamB
MVTATQKPEGLSRWLYLIAQKAGTVALIFALILSLLLIVNYLQTKTVDPLNSQAITRLMSELEDNPRDSALREQIRALDLLARKAYFTHQWQLRTGSYLLFALILVAIVSFKYLSSFESHLPDLTRNPPADDSWTQKLLSRKYIQAGGLALFALAFGLGIVSQSELKRVGLAGAQGSAAAGDFPDLDEIRRNWPNFRGPEGIGIAYHTDVPLEWDGATGRNILWKKTVPLPGFNSPILWGKKLFMSGADRRTQVVYCFDADTGDVIWEHAADDVPGTPERKPRPTEDTGFAAPTMATDGRRVFAIFATGDTVCLDFEGKRIWAKNLGMPENHYGHSSSLIVYRDRLLVQFDQNLGGRLLGLQSSTGRLLFDVPRDVEISWASPILVNTGSRIEVILNSNPFVIAHDPDSGRELWRVRCMQGEVAPSLGYWEGMVFAVNEYARLAAIRLGETPELAWEYIDDLSEVSSPLAAEGLVFMPASYGTITCLDARTGEQYWIEEYEEGFYSSPILAGDRVYLMDMAGVTHIFKAGKEFQSLGRNALGEQAMTVPAFMHDRIYIRGVEHLYCIGK